MPNLQSSAAAIGNGTPLNVAGRSAVAFQTSGTFVGTVTFEGTVNQSDWVALTATDAVSGASATTTTTTGVYVANCAAFILVRARISAYTSGSVTVTAESALSGAAAGGSQIIGKVGIDQTTPGTTDRVTTGGTVVLPSTPTLTVAGQYVTGDYIGPTTTPASFTSAVRLSGGGGVVKSLVMIDKTTTAAVALELWLFSATFTAPTDNAAWDITDAFALTCLGVIPITTAKWYASSSNKVYSDDTLGLVIQPGVTTLFYALVARGTTPTWAAGDLQLGLGVLQS